MRGTRRLPDSLREGRFVVRVRDPERPEGAVRHVSQLPDGQKVFVLEPDAVDIMPMLPWRDAAKWFGVTEARMRRWCREGVVQSSIQEDGQRWVACPSRADSRDWPEIVRYLLGRLGRDGLRRELGQNTGEWECGDAGNTHLHAWARGDVTPNQRNRERLRRLFVREKWREAVGR